MISSRTIVVNSKSSDCRHYCLASLDLPPITARDCLKGIRHTWRKLRRSAETVCSSITAPDSVFDGKSKTDCGILTAMPLPSNLPSLYPPLLPANLGIARRTTVCLRLIRRLVKLKLQELRYGVEVETIRRRRDVVARAIQSVVGGGVTHTGGMYDAWQVQDECGRVWKVVTDASLTSVSPDLRAEVVSPVLAYEDLETLQEVIRAIRKCHAAVDARCGMHVHIDASAFDGNSLANLAKIVHKQEELILTALGVSQERQHTYTKPMDSAFIARIERSRPKTREQMNLIWYGYHNQHPTHYHESRYAGVNFHNVWYRGTIEFRWFESTLHAGKAKSAVQFVLAVAAMALNSRCASSRRRKFNPQSAKYDFRCFLLRLGLNGPEFKTARKFLLSAMPGDAAFKNGRPKPKNHESTDGTETCHEAS